MVIPVAQTDETTVESVTAGDPKAVGASDEEHDGLFELDFLDVATPVALRVGAVRLLGDQLIPIGVHLRNLVHALDRLERGMRSGMVNGMMNGLRVADVRDQVHVIESTDGGSGRRSELRVGLMHLVGAFEDGGRRWVLKLGKSLCGRLASGCYDEGAMTGRDRGGRCVR